MLLVAVACGQPHASGGQPGLGQAALPAPQDLATWVLEPTRIVAVVGDQAILSGDLLPAANQMLQQFEGQVPAAELSRQRVLIMQQLLQRKIDTKLVYLDFLRTFPEDKLDEALTGIHKQIDEQFYGEQIEVLMQQLEVTSLPDLESKLRSMGSSIQRQKREYREQALSRSMVGRQVEESAEITHDQLLEEYRKYPKKYDIPARARWEKLTVLFSKIPDRDAAEQAIVEMGNQVLYGASFAAVAKRHSHGTNASQGGLRDWTTEGALVSEVLDAAIFSLPIDRLSQILEDERGFHIVRVIEREDARRIQFAEAQNEIREKLEAEQRQELISQYVQRLRDKTYLWTVFDAT